MILHGSRVASVMVLIAWADRPSDTNGHLLFPLGMVHGPTLLEGPYVQMAA